MVNSVKSPPNHYETLGLTPSASDEDIRRAFARKMADCRWDPMAATTQICIAHETLSNRIKRADYDRLHGLAPKPQPPLRTMAVTQQKWGPFIAVPTNALAQAAREAASEPHVTTPAEPQRRQSVVRARRREERPSKTRRVLEPQIRDLVAARLTDHTNARNSDDRLLDWKRPVLAIGGFVVAAGAIGAFAGMSVKGDEGSALAEPATTLAVPAPRQASKATAQAPAREFEAIDAPAKSPIHSASVSRSRHPVSRRHVRWRHHRGDQGDSSGANDQPQAIPATQPPAVQPIPVQAQP